MERTLFLEAVYEGRNLGPMTQRQAADYAARLTTKDEIGSVDVVGMKYVIRLVPVIPEPSA